MTTPEDTRIQAEAEWFMEQVKLLHNKDTELREKISDFMVDLMLVVSAEKVKVGADKLDTKFAINQGNKLIQAHNSRLSEIMNLITLHTQKARKKAALDLAHSIIQLDSTVMIPLRKNVLDTVEAEALEHRVDFIYIDEYIAHLTNPTEAGEIL